MKHRIASFLRRVTEWLDHTHCPYCGTEDRMCCIDTPEAFKECGVCVPDRDWDPTKRECERIRTLALALHAEAGLVPPGGPPSRDRSADHSFTIRRKWYVNDLDERIYSDVWGMCRRCGVVYFDGVGDCPGPKLGTPGVSVVPR